MADTGGFNEVVPLRKRRRRRGARSGGGFAMIEVLVSIVILTIGLLGFAALFAKVQQAGNEAYDRAQALLLLESIVNRISANRPAAVSSPGAVR